MEIKKKISDWWIWGFVALLISSITIYVGIVAAGSIVVTMPLWLDIARKASLGIFTLCMLVLCSAIAYSVFSQDKKRDLAQGRAGKIKRRIKWGAV